MKRITVVSLVTLLALIVAACASQATPQVEIEETEAPQETEEQAVEEPTEEAMEEMQSIVDIAVEDGRFTTLVTALQAAELVDALRGEGPFTVFAPTDDAFAALPEGTLDSLLADKEALSNILLYHVVDGKVMAADVVGLDSQEVETLSGNTILVTIDGELVKINESTVVIPDIEASNGVIHVIDAVLLP